MIPKSWKDIPIDKFCQIYDLNLDDSLDVIERDIRLISVALDKTVEEVEGMQVSDFNELRDKISFLKNPKFSPKKLKAIKKGKYKLEFALDIYNDKEVTAGTYIDLMTLTKDPDSVHLNLLKILNTLTTVYKRKWFWWKKAELSKDEKLHLINNNVSVEDAYQYALFFCRYYRNLTEGIQNFLDLKLEKQMKKTAKVQKKLLKKIKKDLKATGDGLQS